MPKDGGNIYQTARKAAGLTQEAAAERLAVSDTSIRAYESGERLPGDDIVARMCAVYNVQYLGLQHLQLKSALLPECVQYARPEPLPVISDSERTLFDEIAGELGDIVQAALALQYAEEV